MSFTLFIILPDEEVCSLRNLSSGVSIRAVRKSLELSAGLPSQTYRLTCPQGHVLHDDHQLVVDFNVWDGYLVRAVFLDSWRQLYDAIVTGSADDVIKHGAVHMRSEVVWVDEQEEGQAREVTRERGLVALFMASFLGRLQVCKALLAVEVNPNNKTSFGRTPLFAAMSRDNDQVMELLLAHGAILEARDCDGVSAVDVARRLAAKQCVRKVRHIQLQRKGESMSPAVRRPGALVIRIPSPHRHPAFSRRHLTSVEHRESSEHQREHVLSSTSSGRQSVRSSLGHTSDRSAVGSSCNESAAKEGAAPSETAQKVPHKPSPHPQPKLLVRSQAKESEIYSWENNLSHASRAPSTTGTLTKTPRRYISGTMGNPDRSASRSSKGTGVSWSDTLSVSSPTPKMLPLRPALKDITIKGPQSVLTTSSTITSLFPTTASVLPKNGEKGDRNKIRPSVQVKFHHHVSSLNSQGPHGPAQEPPGRPPTRQESSTAPIGEEGEQNRQNGGSIGSASITESQEALSVASAPEWSSGNRDVTMRLDNDSQGESDDNGGRVPASRGKGPRSSRECRSRMLVSRQKQQESWRTMKRRIKMAEEQKRAKTKAQANADPHAGTKENFEQWLHRKRHELCRHQHSSEEDTSEDDEHNDRSAENSQAFNDWLKDLKARCLRPQTSTPSSLHRHKTRPLKNLFQVGGSNAADNDVDAVDPHAYMTAYQQWRHTQSSGQSSQASLQDIKEAKKELEEKRKSMLAMALTYEDWLDHTEKRKKLMQAILKADMEKLAVIEQHVFQARRAPHHISFHEWRHRVDSRHAAIRQHQQRLRQEAADGVGDGTAVTGNHCRTSAAVTHQQWVQRKKEAALKASTKDQQQSEAGKPDCARLSQEEKDLAFEAWLQQKHSSEVAELDRHLERERQLLSTLRQKKQPTVTPC